MSTPMPVDFEKTAYFYKKRGTRLLPYRPHPNLEIKHPALSGTMASAAKRVPGEFSRCQMYARNSRALKLNPYGFVGMI